MKINIITIFIDHFRTFYNLKTGKTSLTDIFIFILLPLLLAASSYIFGYKLKAESQIMTVTLFGIFLAFFINIQIAIFGIFQRKNHKLEAKNNLKAKFVAELNSNIAYLNIICCTIMTMSYILYINEISTALTTSILIYLYLNFIATTLMIIKRTYALFQEEYLSELD